LKGKEMFEALRYMIDAALWMLVVQINVVNAGGIPTAAYVFIRLACDDSLTGIPMASIDNA
jgi:hypothetical protein